MATFFPPTGRPPNAGMQVDDAPPPAINTGMPGLPSPSQSLVAPAPPGFPFGSTQYQGAMPPQDMGDSMRRQDTFLPSQGAPFGSAQFQSTTNPPPLPPGAPFGSTQFQGTMNAPGAPFGSAQFQSTMNASQPPPGVPLGSMQPQGTIYPQGFPYGTAQSQGAMQPQHMGDSMQHQDTILPSQGNVLGEHELPRREHVGKTFNELQGYEDDASSADPDLLGDDEDETPFWLQGLHQHMEPEVQEPEDTSEDEVDKALENLDLEDLQDLLRERRTRVVELNRTIKRLEKAPEEMEARLKRLEKQLGEINPGDTVYVHTPALYDIRKAVHTMHHSAHDDAVEHHKSWMQSIFGNEDELIQAENYTQSHSLVMGRDCMYLDRHNPKYAAAIEGTEYRCEKDGKTFRTFSELKAYQKAKYPEEHKHQVTRIDEQHYAGFVHKEADQKDVQRKILQWEPFTAGFWLDTPMNSHLISADSPDPRPEVKALNRAGDRKDKQGKGDDSVPTDWLGEAKAGIYRARHHQEIPSWMY